MTNRFLLDPLRCIRLEGRDARAFAQSQFTADIDNLPASVWSPLAWCDSSGRVLTFMMAHAGEHGVDLVLPVGTAESAGKRLQQFTIGRQVKVTPPAGLSGTFDPDAATPGLACDPTRGMMRSGEAEPDARRLARWQRLDICQALPWLEPAVSQQHLPQWLGLEALGGLAYDKGCYPGQEVIARLHYRGSVKYHLRGVRMADSVLPPPHARVTDPDGATLGRWLRGLATADGTIGLAVLKAGVEDASEILLHTPDRSLSARVTPTEALC